MNEKLLPMIRFHVIQILIKSLLGKQSSRNSDHHYYYRRDPSTGIIICYAPQAFEKRKYHHRQHTSHHIRNRCGCSGTQVGTELLGPHRNKYRPEPSAKAKPCTYPVHPAGGPVPLRGKE